MRGVGLKLAGTGKARQVRRKRAALHGSCSCIYQKKKKPQRLSGSGGTAPSYNTQRGSGGTAPSYNTQRGSGGTAPSYNTQRGSGGTAPSYGIQRSLLGRVLVNAAKSVATTHTALNKGNRWAPYARGCAQRGRGYVQRANEIQKAINATKIEAKDFTPENVNKIEQASQLLKTSSAQNKLELIYKIGKFLKPIVMPILKSKLAERGIMLGSGSRGADFEYELAKRLL